MGVLNKRQKVSIPTTSIYFVFCRVWHTDAVGTKCPLPTFQLQWGCRAAHLWASYQWPNLSLETRLAPTLFVCKSAADQPAVSRCEMSGALPHWLHAFQAKKISVFEFLLCSSKLLQKKKQFSDHLLKYRLSRMHLLAFLFSIPTSFYPTKIPNSLVRFSKGFCKNEISTLKKQSLCNTAFVPTEYTFDLCHLHFLSLP